MTIYASLPLEGASLSRSQAIVNGAELALSQFGNRIGRLQLQLRVLDDAAPGRIGWDPGQTSQNARLAAADRTSVGYIGDLDSGASAVSIPLVGRAGLMQVSPASSAVGLTQSGPGADPGEPQKYYPTGIRTFARLVPDDAVQSRVLANLQRRSGCASTYVLDDGGFDASALAQAFSPLAQAAGLPVQATQAFDPRAPNYDPLVAAVAASGTDCVLISGDAGAAAALLVRQLAAALPHLKLFATGGLAQPSFFSPRFGGIPAALDHRVLLISSVLPAPALPPLGQQFLRRYAERYGAADPRAALGYETMSLLLAAIARASDNGRHALRRSAVRSALLSTRNRSGVLGEYSITAAGDTTLRRYALQRLVRGHLDFWQVLTG